MSPIVTPFTLPCKEGHRLAFAPRYSGTSGILSSEYQHVRNIEWSALLGWCRMECSYPWLMSGCPYHEMTRNTYFASGSKSHTIPWFQITVMLNKRDGLPKYHVFLYAAIHHSVPNTACPWRHQCIVSSPALLT